MKISRKYSLIVSTNDKFMNCETLHYHNLYSIIKAKNYLETSQSFLLYSHVRNINLERDSIKAYARKCGYLRTGSKFVHSSRKYLLTLLIVMTGYVCTYHQSCTGIQKGVYANFRTNLGGSKANMIMVRKKREKIIQYRLKPYIFSSPYNKSFPVIISC